MEKHSGCNSTDEKHHKPMYCYHKPCDCKEQIKTKNEYGQPKYSDGEPTQNEEEAAPKLKLSNNLTMELAALDNALKFSTETDVVD
jgi:hypothetical protein